MIGLEGSGFTICLGVILLLTGVVMYYCKSKITKCEHTISSMMSLIEDLHGEVNALKQVAANSTRPAMVSMPEETTSFSAPLEEESDSEESDEEEEVVDEVVEPANDRFLNHPYQELIPTQLNGDNLTKINESSESEDDEEEETVVVADNSQVKVVELGEIEDLTLQEEEEQSEESETEEEEEQQPIDYSKMQVAALKKMATERRLGTNINKMRKQELVNLLQSH